MSHKFPAGELFPDDDLAPVTSESVRYVYQLKRVNRIVIGLRELDASLGEKMHVTTGLLGPVNAKLAETLLALQENAAELAAQRARQDELIATVRALEARLPDPKQVRREILGDLWQTYEGSVLDNVEQVESKLNGAVSKAAANLVEAASLGSARPTRPAEGSPLRARLIFLRDRIAFRLRKFASDWFMATQLVGVVLLALLVAEQIIRKPL